jgi:hypothetical protein
VLGSWYSVNSLYRLSVGAYTIAKSVVFGGTIYFSLTLLAFNLKALASFVLASATAFLSSISCASVIALNFSTGK